MRQVIALAAVAVIAVISMIAPPGAAGHTNLVPAARSGISAYSFPEQCVVLPVEKTSFVKARALLARLGCRVRRREQTSTAPKGQVVAVVGGTRSYAFGHTVTLIVSSGPAVGT